MTQDELKKAAAWAALEFVKENTIVGVGTGCLLYTSPSPRDRG